MVFRKTLFTSAIKSPLNHCVGFLKSGELKYYSQLVSEKLLFEFYFGSNGFTIRGGFNIKS